MIYAHTNVERMVVNGVVSHDCPTFLARGIECILTSPVCPVSDRNACNRDREDVSLDAWIYVRRVYIDGCEFGHVE
jgi:hypothetical protein